MGQLSHSAPGTAVHSGRGRMVAPTVSTTHLQPEALGAVGAPRARPTRVLWAGGGDGMFSPLSITFNVPQNLTALCVCVEKSVFNFKPW